MLRTMGDPWEFREDRLRLLRGVRLAARFRFQIEAETAAAIHTMAPQVVEVSAERIARELRRMLVHPSRTRAMQLEPRAPCTRLAPRGPDEGAIPGQGHPARGFCRALARVLPAAARFPVHPRIRRAPPRCGRTVRPGSSSTGGIASTITNRPVPQLSPTGSAVSSSSRIKSANGSPGSSLFINIWGGRAAPRVEAQADGGQPGIQELLELHHAGRRLPPHGDTRRVDYCRSTWYINPTDPSILRRCSQGTTWSDTGLPAGPGSPSSSSGFAKASSKDRIHRRGGPRSGWIDNPPDAVGLCDGPSTQASRPQGTVRESRLNSPSFRGCRSVGLGLE